MQTGVVEQFNGSTGVISGNSGDQFAVHASNLVDSIRSGDRVAFDVQEGRQGPIAVNVRLA